MHMQINFRMGVDERKIFNSEEKRKDRQMMKIIYSFMHYNGTLLVKCFVGFHRMKQKIATCVQSRSSDIKMIIVITAAHSFR
jgi:hypothetical protein